MSDFVFVKSSYSQLNGECVEVADNIPGTVAVRDSKTGSGPVLSLTPAAWRTFQTALQAGEAGDAGEGAGLARRG
ncbi:DUF397 domain-containing protein [Streptomyces sp. NPDC088124]|uniref:DUF397 domain-containing protein n=1 Tax=Streptomyces sp. NPDC088124 TaxID=3154654 RepID=UPI0034327D10